uniref:Na/Pi cotransporter family protein n=1 Tax=Dictyoglomus thermophilum TaxID=14 RepID=A0A7C3MJ23_DICTH
MEGFPLSYREVGLLLGGFSLFLYGILQMSSGLEKAVGPRLRSIFERLNSSPFRGLFIGALVTAIVQSSSAVTVLTVTFVNAGLLTLEGALGIIFGANIGTTITAQLVAFKLTTAAPYFLFIGFLTLFLGRRKYVRNIGEAILGFGMIFMGLSLMESSLHALRSWSPFHNAIIAMGRYPIFGILTGAGITAIIQSSSVTTSIVVALAAKGAMDFSSAVPIILGANIGTCVTALLASVGTNISAKRTALAHLFFNVIGVLLIFPFLNFFEKVVSVTSSDVARQVANAHTIFNGIWAFIWIFFTKQYAGIIRKILPGEERVYKKEASFLKPQLLDTPSAALEAAKNELVRMAEIVEDMYNLTMDALFKNSTQNYKDVLIMEDITDGLKASLINYLTQLSTDSLSEGEAKELNAILRAVDDVERIADHLTNVMEKVEVKNSERVEFTEFAWKDLSELRELLYENIRDSYSMIKDSTVSYLDEVLLREERIDYKVRQSKENHIERIKKGICNPIAGIIFSDLLIDLERISDHCVNIAQEFYEVNRVKREKVILR